MMMGSSSATPTTYRYTPDDLPFDKDDKTEAEPDFESEAQQEED